MEPRDYLKTADVWTVLDLIVAEFESDPMSVQCFDLRLVARAIELNKEHLAAPRVIGVDWGSTPDRTVESKVPPTGWSEKREK